MCESCGYSGCRHDWRSQQTDEYDAGYWAHARGMTEAGALENSKTLGSLQKRLAYMVGYSAAKADAKKRVAPGGAGAE